MIALLFLLLADPAVAGDSGFFSKGTGYRHVTFGLSRRYGVFEGEGDDRNARTRATMQVSSIVMNAPFRVAESLYLDGYIGMDLSFGYGRSASAGLTRSGLAYSYRTQAGLAAAYRDGDTRVWVRTGLFAGWEEPRGTRLALGALGSTFGGEVQLPVGYGNRLIGARLIVTPLKESRAGLAVEFERSLRRDEPGHRQALTWAAASWGLWF